MDMAVEIINKTKSASHIQWKAIQEAIVGKNFDVSVALIRENEMRRIRRILRKNKRTRAFAKKHKRSNVFAFLLGTHEGEIILNHDEIRKETKKMKESFRMRLIYLYIHGLLHLKGYTHKTKRAVDSMERAEKKYMRIFSTHIK